MIKTINRILCICLVLALLCGGLALAEAGVTGETGVKSIDEILAGMSLRDKLAQMMFFCPRQWKEDAASDAPAENIRALNDYTRQYIADHRFGGILLYGENCGDAEQLVRLVSDMQQANQ